MKTFNFDIRVIVNGEEKGAKFTHTVILKHIPIIKGIEAENEEQAQEKAYSIFEENSKLKGLSYMSYPYDCADWDFKARTAVLTTTTETGKYDFIPSDETSGSCEQTIIYYSEEKDRIIKELYQEYHSDFSEKEITKTGDHSFEVITFLGKIKVSVE